MGNNNPFDTGMGTSSQMWDIVSELLDGEKLPESLNKALYALCECKAYIVEVDYDALPK